MPAKEVLSLFSIVRSSREINQVFGFDDTYYDLIKALSIPTSKGKNYSEFASARTQLENDIVNGSVSWNSKKNEWVYTAKNGEDFAIGTTAEGVKKISILDTLLGNRYLRAGSIVFFDEPEAALHPIAVSKLIDILYFLTKHKLQFFLATHSYFVIKSLNLLSKKEKIAIPTLNQSIARKDHWETTNLSDGLPESTIVSEAIRLFQEENEVDLNS
jgi:hypothetical protein